MESSRETQLVGNNAQTAGLPGFFILGTSSLMSYCLRYAISWLNVVFLRNW